MIEHRSNAIWQLVVCVLLGLIGMGQAPQTPPAETPPSFPGAIVFPSVTDRHFAFDPDAGVLAVTGLIERHLSLFAPEHLAPGAQATPRKVNTIGEPVDVLYRRLGKLSVFVVATQSPPGLAILQTDGTLIHRYRLPEVPYQLRASHNPDDPYVYWQRWKHRTQFDLQKLKSRDLGEFQGESFLGVSADGKSFLEWSQRQSRSMILQPIGTPLNQNNVDRNAGVPADQTVFVDALGTDMVASGQVTYSADLKSETGTYNFAPQREFPHAPFVAGFFQNLLRVGSVNSHQTLAELTMPPEWFKPIKIDSSSPQPIIPQVFVDAKRGRLIAATPSAILPVSIDSLKLPSEPSLKPLATLPSQIELGDTLEFEITWTGAGPETVELSEAPMGMTLTGRTVRWTPTPEQIGVHKLGLVAKTGDQSRNIPWIVNCSLPVISLPFLARGMNVDPSGTHAIVWGDESEKGARKLAWVNLRSKAIIERNMADKPFVSALLEGENLYLCRIDSVEQIELRGWTSVKSVSFKLYVPLVDTTLIPGRRIMVNQVRIDLPELKLAPEISSDLRHFDDWLTGRTGFGDMIDGVLMKPDGSAPRLLVFPAMLYRYPAWHQTIGLTGDLEVIPLVDTWYPCFVGTRLTMPNRQRSARSYRSGIQLPFNFFEESSEDRTSLRLRAIDQRTMKSLDSIPLPLNASDLGIVQLHVDRDRFHLLQRHRIISGSLSRWSSQPHPFHLEPTQSEFFLKPAEKTSVKYVAAGAREFRLRFNNRNEEPVELKSKTGEFEIPAPPVSELAEMAVFQAYASDRDGKSNDDLLKRYLDSIEPSYQALFGKSLDDKFPVAIQVVVTADHPDQGASVMIHSYIVEISRSSVLQAMNTRFPNAE